MSETIKHTNYGTVNLGCCENLYHTTYHQLKKEIHFAVSIGEIYNPKNYLDPKYHFGYRFPFPTRTTRNCSDTMTILNGVFK